MKRGAPERTGSKPLAGIRIIDATTVLSGPYCTMLLADMGAEVIKIEPPGKGDLLRRSGPFIGSEGAYFLYSNRNKKSITLDVRREEGRNTLIDLIRTADVYAENFRPRVKHRLRIDYDTLAEVNPRLIYCSISGFGQKGSWADRPGFDQIAQGMSGLMSVTGFPDTGPTRVGVAIGDSVAGLFAAYGVLSALFERQRSGKGQRVETSLLEGLIAVLGYQAAAYFSNGEAPPLSSNDHATFAPYGTYRTLDGMINIAAATEQMWEVLADMLSIDAQLRSTLFVTNMDRVRNKDRLRQEMEKQLTLKPSGEWVKLLNEAGIACGPIYDIPQVFEDEHIRGLDMLLEEEHPSVGPIKLIGFPVKMSRTRCEVSSPPPLLGQDTDSVLAELGYSAERIAALREAGVV
jgi:crotonobetainyl-CoA:carnitine CoA-transferase CaiB-like acyl-CoA transferase